MPDVETSTTTTEATPESVASSSQETVEQESDGASFFERLFHTGRAARGSQAEASAETADETQEPQPEARPQGNPLARKPLAELTDAELSQLFDEEPRFQKRLQGEVDRREARRLKRREDPVAYAQQDEDEEAQRIAGAGLDEALPLIAATFDDALLTPLLSALPEAERGRILGLEGAGVGLDGRKLIAAEAIKAIKAEGAREAEANLRRNAAFRKQLLAEWRGETEEPDLIPATTSTPAGQDMNAWMRRSRGSPPQRVATTTR